MRASLPIFLMLLMSSAQATGAMDAGPLVVRLDNGHVADCVEDLTGLCPAELRMDEIGSAEFDARQRVQYVGVGLNETYRTRINGMAGHDLLPAQDLLFIDASSVFLPHNTFKVLARNLGTFEAPAGVVILYFGDDGWGWGYLGPGLNPVDPTIQPQRAHYAYTSGGNSYNGTGGFHELFAEADSDSVVADWLVGPCQTANNSLCGEQASLVAQQVNETTPKIAAELVVYEAELSGSSETLGTARDELPRGSAEPIGPRRTASPPFSGRNDHQDSLVASLHEGRASPDLDLPRPAIVPGDPYVVTAPPIPDPIVSDDPPIPLLGYATGFALAVVITALYSRMKDRSEALLSSRRAQILSTLKTGGACTVAELARITATDWSTALYHVRVLQRTGHLAIRTEGSAVVAYLPGQTAESPRGGPAWKRIIAILRDHGGQIAREDLHRFASDIPLRTRNHALRYLAAKSFIIEVQAGSGPVLTLAR